MKKLIAFFIIIFIQLTVAFAQYVLQLNNLQTGEVLCFKEGAILCYQPSWEDNTFYGRLNKVNENSILIDDKEYQLEEIALLGGHTKTRQVVGNIMEFMGKALLISGQFTTHAGLEIISSGDIYYVATGGVVSGIGLCVWGVGYLVDFAMAPAIKTIKPQLQEKGWVASITSAPAKETTTELYGY
jgi:uncharacterized protein YkvS